MSLDISLTVKTPIKMRGTGVFVRDGGRTRELTPDEVLDKWPNAEVSYTEYETTEVFDRNITHNLGKMANKAGIYYAMWRPDEKGWKTAKDVLTTLEIGLVELQANPDKYKKLNPENGWGSYDDLVDFVEVYVDACRKYPEAVIEVSR